MSHEDIRVRSLLHARLSFVRTTRFVSGVVSVILLTLLFTWTERTAEIQTSGPQILQVYTRSAFYGIVLIGIVFGVYVLTRAGD